MPPTTATFRDRLLQHRQRLALTQEQLADKILVGRSSIGRWENGETYPDVAELLRLCDLFAVTPNYLVGYSDQPHGLWPDQYVVDDEMVEAMRLDRSLPGTPMWKWPRRPRIVGAEEAIELQRDLGLKRTQ